jgi:serine/threonine-protein kinase
MSSRKRETAPSKDVKESSFKGILARLRKRHIIETLAAFIGGGWLIIEVVHFILVGHYHFPEKTLDITIVTLLCALACTLIWRWFSGRERPRKFKLELVLIFLVVLVTVLLDINLLLHLRGPESMAIPAAKWKNSIAVLPFVDMSPQKDQDWFCDGITDEIIGQLSNIGELKVPARTSVFFFKGKDQDIRDIGKKLGVATVLEGSIQKVESRLRARVQLINIADGFHLWSEEFDREMKDVFAIQDEIALAVVAKLKLTLLSDEKARLVKAQAINPVAYEAYLKGRLFLWQWTDESVTNALRHFQRALEIEPNFALAHAGVALAYIWGSTWLQLWPPSEGVPKGKEAALKAIQLDPMLADGYATMAWALANFDWDWAGAEKNFKRAVELSPHSTLALDGYANILVVRGRFDEALAVLNRALELDPLSPGLHHDMGWTYFDSAKFDPAMILFRKALELDPNFHSSRNLLGWSYLLTGKPAEALAEFQTIEQSAPDLPWVQGSLGYLYGVTGRPADARNVLAKLDQISRKRYVTHWARAIIYLGLGQKDSALDWLEKACEDHDGWMWDMHAQPWWAPLRNEPRFQAIVKKIGLIKSVKERFPTLHALGFKEV